MIELAQYRYTANADEFEEAYQLFMRRRKNPPRLLSDRMVPIFGWVWFGSAVSVFVTAPETRSSPALFAFALLGLWFALGARRQARRARRKQWQRQLEPGTTELPITLTLSDEQISFHLEGKSEARFNWSSIIGLYETESILDLQVSELMFYFIPKRGVDEKGLELIRSFVPEGKAIV